MIPSAAGRPWPRLDRVDLLALGLILVWGVVRLAPDLGHDRIWDWDESLHQVVTRHVHDHPFEPTLYEDPVHPLTDLRQWWGSNIWLLKPPGTFWLGALMMTFTGVSPLAFRLGGLLSELVAAATVYLLARRVAARFWSLVAALGFLSLPLGWTFTQARFVGDELDLTLTGAVCVAMFCLFQAIWKDSWRWACAAGAATGVAYLFKTFLALTPLGVAGVLWGLGVLRVCKGPRLKLVLLTWVAAFAVAGPWNIYAALKWPDVYHRAFTHTVGFVSDTSAEEGVPGWRRPIDAIFNEVNQTAFDPVPQVLTLVVGVWLLIRAYRKRELIVVGTAVWLWSTWFGHTLASVKIASHIWNGVVAGFIGIAIVLADVWASVPLALAVAAGIATPWLLPFFPFLARMREALPAKLGQTRQIPGLADGALLVVSAAGLGGVLQLLRPLARRVPTWAYGVLPALALGWLLLWKGTVEQSALAAEAAPDNNLVYSREVGRAIDALTPKKSLLLLQQDLNCPHQHEHFNLMFWSDRLVHNGRDPQDYPQAGYHPYLVSAAAEPFAPLEGVPADAWLRAYDMAVPIASPPPLPAGVLPVDVREGNLRVLGLASGRSDATHDHYAFIVHSDGVPGALPVTFLTARGPVAQRVQPEATLLQRARLANVPWYVLPAVGPPRAEVREIQFGPHADQHVVLAASGR